MSIKVTDPYFQTVLFSVIFLCLLLISFRKLRSETFFSKEVTNQLKGFAILAVVFSHISFFLFYELKFLYPYNILAGVGVDLFLFLSGFGLTVSHLKSPLSPMSFYRKRLSKLFIPLWIVVTAVLLVDFIALQRTYPLTEMVHAFLGFYPRADVLQNLDSPLWYFSLIFFYYLIFPLTFVRKIPLLSPLLVLGATLLILSFPLPINPAVIRLYELHNVAFPLGMLFGLTQKVILRRLVEGSNSKHRFFAALRMTILILSIGVFLYTAVHSGVGADIKITQGISLITTLSLIIIFSLSKFDYRLFSFLGIYSYEIYLLHWPILSRFNLFAGFPPFLIVILNLGLIFLLGYGLQKLTSKITKLLTS